jgi:hypothetical protein
MKNQGFQVAAIARSPFFGAGARYEIRDFNSLSIHPSVTFKEQCSDR